MIKQCISPHLKGIGMIRQLRNCLPHELTERDIQRRIIICAFLFQRQERKDFLHQIVIEEKNGFTMSIQSAKQLGLSQVNLVHKHRNRISMVRKLCFVSGGIRIG